VTWRAARRSAVKRSRALRSVAAKVLVADSAVGTRRGSQRQTSVGGARRRPPCSWILPGGTSRGGSSGVGVGGRWRSGTRPQRRPRKRQRPCALVTRQGYCPRSSQSWRI
jgi:hypothetical protein